ncbi:hypothetical protein [Sulfitobacter albidus]|uniref:hypothetical protein n=1 Tax=Sulfitobacter albidus TaxID=2829501 RepID=UPI0032AFAA93
MGERGWQDADGNLYLQGRAGRMITVADRNIFLDAVTDTLAPLAHPRHLAVIARPDPLRGARASVVVSGPPDATLGATLADACAHAFGLRAAVTFHPDFPLRPSGKPDLAALEAP